MNFDILAKDLLANKTPQNPNESDVLAKLGAAGWDQDTVLRELRDLYDTTDDDSIKRQIMDMIMKAHGAYASKEQDRAVPIININIKGDQGKLFNMICPPLREAAA